MATKSKTRKTVRARKTKRDAPVLTESRLKEIQNELVIPYKFLRVTIGVLGMLMPAILYVGGALVFRTGIQGSISAYYYTGMRDVMVGILFALGVFLFSYKGYGTEDDIAGYLACTFAIGVALFPTLPKGDATELQERISVVHHISAALFLLTLSYFSLFLFTKSNKKKSEMAPRKRIRNTVYQACGGIILLCILLLGIYLVRYNGEGAFLGFEQPIFWLETFSIFAFGVSWFVKSEVILKDEEDDKPTVEWKPQLVDISLR